MKKIIQYFKPVKSTNYFEDKLTGFFIVHGIIGGLLILILTIPELLYPSEIL